MLHGALDPLIDPKKKDKPGLPMAQLMSNALTSPDMSLILTEYLEKPFKLSSIVFHGETVIGTPLSGHLISLAYSYLKC